MSFGATITLPDISGSQVFNLQGFVPNGADYIEDDSSPTLTRRVAIRHSNAGASIVKGQTPIRRHLLQLKYEAWNADLGKTEVMIGNLTITKDPGSTFATSDVRNLCAQLKEFLDDDAMVDRLLRDES